MRGGAARRRGGRGKRVVLSVFVGRPHLLHSVVCVVVPPSPAAPTG